MRSFVIVAAMLGLVGGTSLAYAQNHDEHHGDAHRDRPDASRHQSETRPQPHAESHRGPTVVPPRGDREHHDVPAMHRSDQMHRMNSPPPPGPRADHVEHGRPGPRFDHAMEDHNRSPHRDFSGVRNYHRNFQAERHYHGPRYRRPRGYYVHHWVWGEFLPPLFWARNYWLGDYWRYDLPPPPFGAVWVRVGDDAVLIDRDSGEIIEVEYGIFY